jgi:hypothetical protein
LESLHNSIHQQGDMNRYPYWWSTNILGATVQNLVTWVTMQLWFVQPWNGTFIICF